MTVGRRPGKALPRNGTLDPARRTVRLDPRADILRAAALVLGTVGYARLTMRAVASEAGLAVGNLVYHFPSKRDLVHALIGWLVMQYQAKSSEYLTDPQLGATKGFGNLVQWFIRDSVSPSTNRLFRELWTMALHDTKIAEAMDGFYEQAHVTAAALLRVRHPHLTAQESRDIVQLMGMVSEGANVIYGTAGLSHTSLTRVSRLAADLLEQAASRTDAANSAGRASRTGRRRRDNN